MTQARLRAVPATTARAVRGTSSSTRQSSPRPSPIFGPARSRSSRGASGRSGPELLADCAARLARALGLQFVDAVSVVRPKRPQAEMLNSAQQVRNVYDAFGAFGLRVRVPSGPVLLFDDLVDSRWTLTTFG